MKSVKPINRCKSVIQTIYDVLKAHGGVPIAIGIKAGTKEEEEEGSESIIQSPIFDS